MKKITAIFGVFIILTLLISGCGSSVDSSDVKSEAFYPIYTVTRENGVTGIEASAEFCVGGSLGSSVELTNGDKVFCNNVPLERSKLSLEVISIDYKTTFQEALSEYVFRFERGNTVVSSTVGSLPQMPTIQGTLANIKNNDSLEINWDATVPGTNVTIFANYSNTSVSGTKAQTGITDNGHYTLPAGFFGDLQPGTYTVKIEVARRKEYPINATFFKNGGTGVAISIDSQSFQYIKE